MAVQPLPPFSPQDSPGKTAAGTMTIVLGLVAAATSLALPLEGAREGEAGALVGLGGEGGGALSLGTLARTGASWAEAMPSSSSMKSMGSMLRMASPVPSIERWAASPRRLAETCLA